MKNRSRVVAWPLAITLFMAAIGAFAQTTATLNLYGTRTQIAWGEPLNLYADVFYSGPPCPGSGSMPAMEGDITLRANGIAVQTRPFWTAFGRGCNNSQWSAEADFFMTNVLGFGTFALVAEYSGSSTLPAVSTAPITIRVDPPFTFALPDGQGVLHAAIADPGGGSIFCSIHDAALQDRAQLSVPAPPANLRFPYGHVAFNASGCVSFNFGAAGPIRQDVLLEFPEVPSGSELWAHETSKDGASAQWKRLDATFNGRQVRVDLQGASTTVFDYDKFIKATLALAVPPPQPSLELISITPTELRWGEHLQLSIDISAPCTATFPSQVFLKTAAGTTVSATGTIPSPPPTCPPSGAITARVPFAASLIFSLPPGAHFLQATATIGGTQVASQPFLLRLNPEFTLPGPIEPLNVGVSVDPFFSTCSQRLARRYDRETVPVPMLPPNLRTPYEFVTVESSACAPGGISAGAGFRPGEHTQVVALEVPRGLPPGAELWVYDRLRGAPGWRRVGTTSELVGLEPPMNVVGEFLLFQIFGDEPLVSATMAVAIPQPFVRDLDLQDLWWGGSGESGWGMSIAKNDDRLFATLFAYDTNGRPQWLLLQDAKWDAVHEVYHGNLYRPTSAPYGNYDSARFSMGEAVGTGSLSFLGKDDGHFDYTIDGYSGGKTLERYMFAPHGDVRAPRAGMWWGGSGQDGWGVSIQEQGDVMFATWYSYGSDGNVTWLYMPAGRKTGASTYAGPVYRTSGPAWVGTRFDGSKTRASAVGSMELTFKDADHAIMTTVVDGISFSQSLQRFPF